MRSRRGITPVVAIVLLLMMTVAAAGGAYAWIQSVQSDAQEDTTASLAASLAVRDVRCDVSNITVTLRNSGDTALTGDTADLYAYQEDRLVDATTVSLADAGITGPGALGTVTSLLNASLDPRTATRVELAVPADDISTSASCTSAPSTITGAWRYRQPVTVTAPAGEDLSDHQVNWTVDTATPIANGEMNASCSDLRVWDPVHGTIPYWHEGCGDTATEVWTNVPTIPAGTSRTIYLYTGNVDAPDTSDGDAVFVQFDDFEDGSMDDWATQGASVETVTSPVRSGSRAGRTYGGSGGEDAQLDETFYLEEGRLTVWSRVTSTDTMRQEINVDGFATNDFNSFTYEANGEFGTHHTARGTAYSLDTWYRWDVRFDFPNCTFNVTVTDTTGTLAFNWSGGMNDCYSQATDGSRFGNHRIDDEIFQDNYRLSKLPIADVSPGTRERIATH